MDRTNLIESRHGKMRLASVSILAFCMLFLAPEFGWSVGPTVSLSTNPSCPTVFNFGKPINLTAQVSEPGALQPKVGVVRPAYTYRFTVRKMWLASGSPPVTQFVSDETQSPQTQWSLIMAGVHYLSVTVRKPGAAQVLAEKTVVCDIRPAVLPGVKLEANPPSGQAVAPPQPGAELKLRAGFFPSPMSSLPPPPIPPPSMHPNAYNVFEFKIYPPTGLMIYSGLLSTASFNEKTAVWTAKDTQQRPLPQVAGEHRIEVIVSTYVNPGPELVLLARGSTQISKWVANAPGGRQVQLPPGVTQTIKLPKVTLTAAPASPTSVSAPITVTAQLIDAPAGGAATFAFTAVGPNQATVPIPNVSPTKAEFTPTAGGAYIFKVAATVGNFHPTATTPHCVFTVPVMPSLAANPASPAPVGSNTTFTAGVSLPPGPCNLPGATHKFQFSYYTTPSDAERSATTAFQPSAAWTPTPNPKLFPGTYTVRVYVQTRTRDDAPLLAAGTKDINYVVTSPPSHPFGWYFPIMKENTTQAVEAKIGGAEDAIAGNSIWAIVNDSNVKVRANNVPCAQCHSGWWPARANFCDAASRYRTKGPHAVNASTDTADQVLGNLFNNWKSRNPACPN